MERPPLKHWHIAALAVVHAALFVASFHPLALAPLAWVAFAPFAVIVARGTRAQALWGGFLATFLAGGTAVIWLRLFGPEPWLATAFGFGLYGLFMAAVGRPMASRLGLPATLWLPIVVAAQEYLRGHLFFWAFPWVFLGHSQVEVRPLLQSADLGGAILLSFVMAAGSGVLADLALGASRRAVAIRGAAVAAVVVGLCVYGHLRAGSIEVIGGGPKLLAVQANISQEIKNANARRPNLLLEHRTVSFEGIEDGERRGERPDIVAWPETMCPVEWHYDGGGWPYDERLQYAALDINPKLRTWFEELGQRSGAVMIVGSLHGAIETKTGVKPGERDWEFIEHNSAFFVSPEGKVIGRYDKMRPAPMSEYTPFHRSWPAAYNFLRDTFVPPGFSQFDPGLDVPIWEVKGWKLAASVCFDITFPQTTNLAVKNGADAIVNVSNYAWFKDSAELDLARAQTIFRAVETRRGVAAVCNGGITSFVDPLGNAEDIWGPNAKGERSRKEVRGFLLRPLTTSRARTLCVAWGEWPGALSVAAALGLAALGVVRGRRRDAAAAAAAKETAA